MYLYTDFENGKIETFYISESIYTPTDFVYYKVRDSLKDENKNQIMLQFK